MDKDQIKKEYKIISDQIRKYNTELGPFFDLKMNLKDFSQTLYSFEATKEHLLRQNLLKKVIDNKLNRLFGDEYKEELKIDLEGKLALNIADHHQIINHPVLLSSNIISSTDKFLKDRKQNAIIVISSGDVPPNNYFSRNGFTFHDKRVPLFSNTERELCSYYIPKRDFNFVERLKLCDRWKEFNQVEKEFLMNECETLKSYDYSRCNNYIDQISIIVKNSWKRMFEEKLRNNLPELIYLTQEEIVTDCLVELLENDDNIISKSIFDNEFRNCVLNNFRGIVVTWNEKEEKGTHFFWRKYPDRNQSIRLYVENGILKPKDPRFNHLSIPLEKKIIIELLKKREIYPSLFTIFGVLNFYSGVKPLVGYGSVIYLHLMKLAWEKTLKEMKMQKELELLKTVQTNGLVAGLTVAFQRLNGKVRAQYGYDIIFEGGLTDEYLRKIFSMPYSDFISVAAVDLYDYTAQKYIPADIKIIPQITSNDFAELNFNWL